jgi:hypothetical protein
VVGIFSGLMEKGPQQGLSLRFLRRAVHPRRKIADSNSTQAVSQRHLSSKRESAIVFRYRKLRA